MRALNRAFALLVALSLGTTVLTQVVPHSGPLPVALFLALSAWKARVILNDYLGLGATRPWRRGFNGVVLGFVALAYGHYLVPLMG